MQPAHHHRYLQAARDPPGHREGRGDHALHGWIIITPRAHARARGYVIGRGVYILLYIYLHFFWNQTFISENTHFQRSILTQIGFSSNFMASGTA